MLDPSAADLAVRMALGETQIMAATKRALADEGVDVAKLEAAAAAAGAGAAANKALPRSADTLLVKNLPYSASAAELEVSTVPVVRLSERHFGALQHRFVDYVEMSYLQAL